jgi:serine protease Do
MRNGNKWVVLPLLALAGAIFGVVVAGSLRLVPPSFGAGTPTPTPEAGVSVELPSFANIAAEALKSVVTITSTEIVKSQPFMSPFGNQNPFEFFFGPQQGTPEEHKQVSGGSGFVISPDGEILTNNHVVAGAEKIRVKLRDREVYTAKVIGRDPSTDVALIKIDPKEKLVPLPLGDSDKLRVGEWVMAVGNPLYFEGTVTVGVVSGKGRRGLSDDPNAAAFENLIQTDAAINFGNSGGPLINTSGQVVGINSAMIQPAQNIGFAVAINTAKAILPQLREHGKVVRGMLGVQITEVDQDIMKAFGLPSMDGAFVESVVPDGPAAKAGVQHGDTIIGVDDKTVKEPKDLVNYVSATAPGQKVRLTILRDGKTVHVTATLVERKIEQAESGTGEDESGPSGKIGVSIMDITPQIRQHLRLPASISGVVVTGVKSISPAADQGIAPGDVITEVNGTATPTVDDFRKEVSRVKKGDYLRLYVRRFTPQEISRFVVIKVQ